jgi:hypothetical protein
MAYYLTAIILLAEFVNYPEKLFSARNLLTL